MKPRPPSTLSARVGAALLLTAAADFLLFGQFIGISAALFAGLLAVAVIVLHAAMARRSTLVAGAAIAVLAFLPLVEDISALSMSVAVLGLSAFVLFVSGRLRSAPGRAAGQIVSFLLAAPLRLPRDLLRSRKAAARMNRAGLRLGGFAVWAMPVALGAVFLALFGIANPVIDYWFSLIDFRLLLDLLDIRRVAFWLCVALLVWAFLRPRLPRWFGRTARPVAAILPGARAKAASARADVVFGKAAILRSLILFNALFAVQTILDAAYLWGGVALPDGLTYAGYAHRGAYPLIATALLAAVFVLVAMRPGSPTSADRLVRTLVYLWTAQNVVLVISSILRLDLYVGIYSLTWWRVAAFIWMGLVAAGLVLIAARIALAKSNEWLLGANLLTLSAVLYACCFINFAAIIAHYNVMHSREMDGGGLPLDVSYLYSLGPAAIPAIDLLPHRLGEVSDRIWLRQALKDRLLQRLRNWRAWTFRDWRLGRYVRGDGSQPLPVYPDLPVFHR